MQRLTVLLLLLFSLGNVRASIDPLDIVVLTDVSSKTFVLRTTLAVNEETTLDILDQKETSLYQITLSKGQYLNKRYPLATLPAGQYTLVFTDSRGRTTQPIVANGNGVTRDLKQAQRIYFPRVDLSADRLLVVNYANESSRRVSIALVGQDGATVFTDQVKTDGPVKRAYQLDKLAPGDYYVTVDAYNVKKHVTAIQLD